MDTYECLQKLFLDFKSNEDRDLFARVFNINESSFARWQRDKYPGQGLNLIKVRVGLDFLGYGLSDSYFCDIAFRDLSEMVAFGVVDLQYIGRKLGFYDNKGILSLLVRGRSTSEKRKALAREIVDDFYDELIEERELANLALEPLHYLKYDDYLPSGVPLNPVPKRVKSQSKRPSRHSEGKQAVTITPQYTDQAKMKVDKFEVFDGLVQTLLPFLEYFNDSDPEVRKDLRKYVGYSRMSHVAELFRNISSEKYKEMQSSRREKG